MNNQPFDDTGVIPGFAFLEEMLRDARNLQVQAIYARRNRQGSYGRRAAEEEAESQAYRPGEVIHVQDNLRLPPRIGRVQRAERTA